MPWPKLTATQQLEIRNLIADKETYTALIANDDTVEAGELVAKITEANDRIQEVLDAKQSAPKRTKKFKPPTLGEVKGYALARLQRVQLAIRFFDYYHASGWRDMHGKQIHNWKAKFISWESRNGNTKTGKQSDGRNDGTHNTPDDFDFLA